MQVEIIRWQGHSPPEEQQLRKDMQQQGLSPYAWSNGPGDHYAIHSHGYQKILYCVRGSIRFVLPDERDEDGHGTTIDLNPGDCLQIPAGIRHSAEVGPRGVTCLEAAQY